MLQDAVIHIRDVSHPDTASQKKVVLATLRQLDLPAALMDNIIEVCNKIDKLPQ
jgi:GTP-binding protein HflX